MGLDAKSKSDDKSKSDKDPKKSDIKGLDEPSGDEKLKLVSQEDEKFTVNRKVALMSELVKTMVEGGM